MALSNFSKLNLKPEFITLFELILWLSSNNWLLSPKIIFTILAGIFGRKIDLFNLFPSNLTSSDCGIGFGDTALKIPFRLLSIVWRIKLDRSSIWISF